MMRRLSDVLDNLGVEFTIDEHCEIVIIESVDESGGAIPSITKKRVLMPGNIIKIVDTSKTTNTVKITTDVATEKVRVFKKELGYIPVK